MSISLSGLAFSLLALIMFAVFIFVLIITSIILAIQKNKTQKVFRELKGVRFFFANIFTGIFLFALLLILSQVKPFIIFLDHTNSYTIIVLAFYFLPCFCFLQLFKRRANSINNDKLE